jgi:hypothetical protein
MQSHHLRRRLNLEIDRQRIGTSRA